MPNRNGEAINHASPDAIVINPLLIRCSWCIITCATTFQRRYDFRYGTRPITAPDLALSPDWPIVASLSRSLTMAGQSRELVVRARFLCGFRAQNGRPSAELRSRDRPHRRGRSSSIRVRRYSPTDGRLASPFAPARPSSRLIAISTQIRHV